MITRLAITALLPCLLLAAGQVAAAEERDGGRLYSDFGCLLCHGVSGHRGASGGPLAVEDYTFEAFRQLVRFPPGSMPAYPPAAVSDAQLRRMLDYLEARESPPPVEEVEALRRLRERLYEEAPGQGASGAQ